MVQKINKKILFLFAFVIIYLNFNYVYGEYYSTNNGLLISPQEKNLIQYNHDYDFSFFVQNSTGAIQRKSDIDYCNISLYDKNGILLTRLNASNLGDEWSAEIKAGNFSYIGDYQLKVICISSDFGGVTIQKIKANYSGKTISSAQAILYSFLILLTLLIIPSLFFAISKLPNENVANTEGEIISINYLKYLRSALLLTAWMVFVGVLFVSSNIAFSYLEDELLGKTLFMFFRISFLITPIMIILWVVKLIARIYEDKEIQAMLNKGFFPSGRRF